MGAKVQNKYQALTVSMCRLLQTYTLGYPQSSAMQVQPRALGYVLLPLAVVTQQENKLRNPSKEVSVSKLRSGSRWDTRGFWRVTEADSLLLNAHTVWLRSRGYVLATWKVYSAFVVQISKPQSCMKSLI